MGYSNIGQMVMDRATTSANSVAFRVRKPGGDQYEDFTWKQVSPRMERIAAGLLSALPNLEHAAPITIIGNTSMDWILCDFAALSVGLRTVPIYASLLPEEVGYCHQDLSVVIAICENAEQVQKVRTMRTGFRFFDKDYGPESLRLQHIVVIDPTGLAPASDWESLADLEKRGAERAASLKADIDERRGKVTREGVATYTYTSGTTGPPKAVIQTHDNMLSMLESIGKIDVFNAKVRAAGLFLFLPLAHSFGRLVELAGPFYETPLILSTVPTILDDLKLSLPGLFPSAPRVFEKMKSRIDGTVAGAPPVRQRLFHWAMGVGKATIPYRLDGKHLPFFLGIQYRLADRLVLSKLRARLGLDRAEYLLSGSAPLGRDVHEFFLAMGLTLLEGYGLTETCPALTVTVPKRLRIGTVGPALPGVTLKIMPPENQGEDGEIIARGPNITQGYHNRADANRDAFDAEGWFHTGDLGSLDAEGNLRITGRKKDLFKTSGGKYIAPIKLESRLKNLPFVQEAVVIGDRRNFCVVLFSLDKEGLETWADQHGAKADPRDPAVLAALKDHVAEVNKTLASYETVKYFRTVPEPFSVENGILTASLKVKRKVVEQRYESLIEEMYATPGSSAA
jgi:long-chain acyl-CoA synthetase